MRTPATTPPARKIRNAAVTTLQELAHITGGRYYQAHDTNVLLQACRSIDELERTPIQSYQYSKYYAAQVWFALAALVVWTLTFGLERTLFGRKLP